MDGPTPNFNYQNDVYFVFGNCVGSKSESHMFDTVLDFLCPILDVMVPLHCHLTFGS